MVEHSLEDAAGQSSRSALAGAVWSRAFDKAIVSLAASRLAGALQGSIIVSLPSGITVTLGDDTGGETAQVQLVSYKPLWRCMTRGPLGFAESYMRDELRSSDLAAVFRFFIANKPALDEAGRGWFRVRRQDRSYHGARRNTRTGSRRNIAEHYDLGNDFYRLWLDAGMQYSSALYRNDHACLEAAQAAKLDAVMHALDLKPDMSVLEIGCGWGAVAERVVAAGAELVALTLSTEQATYTRERLSALRERSVASDIRLQDYRDVDGCYDRVVSIEMIEAVGEEYWPAYFETVKQRLAPGGAAVIQAITIEEKSFAEYRGTTDFIQRYVFPGGMLPTKARIVEEAAAAGLVCETLEEFGLSYARTLRQWRRRFKAAWPEIQKLGFDERFRRLWNYYLVYCEVGFEQNVIDVALYRLRHAE